MKRWLVLAVLAMCAAGCQDTGGVVLQIEPAFPVFVKGESLQFLLTVRNKSDKEVRICLGAGGTDNLRVTVTGGNGNIITTNPVYPGLTLFAFLDVAPDCAGVRHPFLLDDFVRLDTPGDYRLSVQIDGTLEASTRFRILPDTEASRGLLSKRYLELSRKWDSQQPAFERVILRKAVTLSRHAFAFEMQRKLFASEGWENDKEYRGLVEAMVASRSPDAARALIKAVLANPNADAMEKSIALNRLREAHVETWQISAYELLLPYLDDIKNAVPMDISD